MWGVKSASFCLTGDLLSISIQTNNAMLWDVAAVPYKFAPFLIRGLFTAPIICLLGAKLLSSLHCAKMWLETVSKPPHFPPKCLYFAVFPADLPF